MSGFDIQVAEMEGEKHDHVFEYDVRSQASSEYSSSDGQSLQDVEKTGLLWSKHRSPRWLGDKASPRQNSALIKYIIAAIAAAFAVLNLVKIVDTIHTNQTIRLERQIERQIDDEIPAVGVVMASFQKQDVAWAHDIPEEWRIYRYIMNDPSIFPNVLPPRTRPTHDESLYKYTYTVPRNHGREAQVYLSYIIDHYDRLPLFNAFIHGHDTAWHMVEHQAIKLRALNLTAVANDGYASFRCHVWQCNEENRRDLSASPNSFPLPSLKVLPEFWKLIFPNEPPPKDLRTPINGQFIVPRDTIRARPLEFYQSLRRLIERDPRELFKALPHLPEGGKSRGHSWVLGLMFEHMWHIIMGQNAYHCPPADYCRKTVFSDAVRCNKHLDLKLQQAEMKDISCRVNEDNLAKAAVEQEDAIREARVKLRNQIMAT